MAAGQLGEASAVMGGEVISGDPGASWRGAALDSRRVTGGELFFALPGEQADGHAFVAAALEAGAAAAVVSGEVDAPAGGGLIRVDDTFEALHALTRDVRRRVPGRLVAITGSVGKTTTKELLAAMLARRYRVARSPGNLNNLYGFPLALLGVDEGTEWMVAEMGMSVPGELGRVSRLGRPDVAVFTGIRGVHLENFESIEGVAKAKAELLEGLEPGGVVIANRDDPRVMAIAAGHLGRVVTFGYAAVADVRAADIQPLGESRPGHRFALTHAGRRQPIELALHGRYNVDNFLAAAATAIALGVELEDIAAAAAQARPLGGRGVVRELPIGAILLDDSYNSNPFALSKALMSARALAAERHWVVLGDMLELGPGEIALHHRAGVQAAELGFSPILGVGQLARELVRTADGRGVDGRWFADAAAAAKSAAAELRAGDLVLVKGSRGVGLEVVVAALEKAGGVT